MSRKKSPETTDRKPDKLSFEEALDRLEQIVKELEDGERGLEDSICLYEEGRQLVRLSMTRLGEAQSRIEELVKTEDGWDTHSIPENELREEMHPGRKKSQKEPAEDELPF